MNVSLYQAASALNANSRWQELISENLANSSLNGYKRKDLSFAAIQAGLMPQPASAPGNLPAHFSLAKALPSTVHAQGELTPSSEPWDVAIEGAGFFEIQLPNGSFAYTRNGSFQLNSLGQLVTKSGYLVMGDAGPIQLDVREPAPITITTEGEIMQGEDSKGKIRVVNFNDPSLLSSNGSFFVANHPNLQAIEMTNPVLRQGYLEASNASAVHEMANLIMAMRNFEANQRVVQAHDERMGRAISELGMPG